MSILTHDVRGSYLFLLELDAEGGGHGLWTMELSFSLTQIAIIW